MIRLFLDANVLFTAAHNPRGKAALVIDLGRRGHWQIATSAFAVEEARRNLARKYPQCLDAFERTVADLLLVDPGPLGDCPLDLPKKDQPIFLAARRGAATHLLTGDLRHFGAAMNVPAQTGGILIQTVADFLSDLVNAPDP